MYFNLSSETYYSILSHLYIDIYYNQESNLICIHKLQGIYCTQEVFPMREAY